MKKTVILLLLISASLAIYSQEPIKDVSQETEVPLSPMDSLQALGIEHRLTTTNPELLHFDDPYARSPLDTSIPVGFTDSYSYYLNQHFFYQVTGRSEIWEGITSINSAMFSIHYAADIVNVDIGSSLWKFDFHGLPYRDAVYSADASVHPLPWLTLGVYGQHSIMSKRNFEKGRVFMPPPMIPMSGFGGYSTVMFNETFGIRGGIGRQFNTMLNKWETTYTIGPAIEFKKKKKK